MCVKDTAVWFPKVPLLEGSVRARDSSCCPIALCLFTFSCHVAYVSRLSHTSCSPCFCQLHILSIWAPDRGLSGSTWVALWETWVTLTECCIVKDSAPTDHSSHSHTQPSVTMRGVKRKCVQPHISALQTYPEFEVRLQLWMWLLSLIITPMVWWLRSTAFAVYGTIFHRNESQAG